MYVYCVNARGRGPEDLGGLGEEKPGEIQREDDEFDLDANNYSRKELSFKVSFGCLFKNIEIS